MLRNFLFLCLLAAAACQTGCVKAKASTAHEEKPAEKAELKWEELKTEDGSFSAQFPGTPRVTHYESQEGKLTLVGLDLPGDLQYSIMMTQVNEPEEGASEKERLKAFLQQAALSYGASGKILSSKDVKVEGKPAVEYTLSFERDKKKLKLRSRGFFAHDMHQMFQLVAAGPDGAPEDSKFLDSFKLGKYTPGVKQASPTPAPAASHGAPAH